MAWKELDSVPTIILIWNSLKNVMILSNQLINQIINFVLRC